MRRPDDEPNPEPVLSGQPAESALPAPPQPPAKLQTGRLIQPVGADGRGADSTVDLIGLLRALRRRWIVASVLGLACAGLAAGVAWVAIAPSKHTARALLSVASLQPSIIFKTSENRADFATYQRTQTMLIKSRLVLNSALRDPQVAKLEVVRGQVDPVAWLEEKIQVGYAGEILTIAMTGAKPNELALLVNAVTSAYLREIVNVEAAERRKRYESLKEIYSAYQTRLESRRQVLRKLADQVGSTDKETLRFTHELAIERRSIAERDLMDIQADLRRAEAELEVLQQRRDAAASAPVSEAVIEQYVARDPVIVSCLERLAKVESMLSHAGRIARRENDHAIRQARAEQDQLKRKMAARKAQLRDAVVAQIRSQAQAPGVLALEEEVEVLRRLERQAAEQVKTLTVESRSIFQNSSELESIKDEITHADAAAKKVGDEVEALNVELRAPARVQLIESADAPRMEADRRPKFAAIAGFGAFAMVLFGISWAEFRARRISSADEVIRGLGLRLVGALPALPPRVRRRPAAAGSLSNQHWHRVFLESVDATRTMLMHTLRSESIRVFMISSATGGEGKTSLACHLATSLARIGRRTLLVDGDLRKPAVHKLFQVPMEPGFCDLLRDEASLAQAIVPSPAEGLWILPAGRCDSRALHALAWDGVGTLFDRLRAQYDFIVVDTSPVLPVADALLIGQHVDAAVCSVLRDVSRVPNVHEATERLSTLGIRVLGAVMTGVPGERYYAGDYHYVSAGQG